MRFMACSLFRKACLRVLCPVAFLGGGVLLLHRFGAAEASDSVASRLTVKTRETPCRGFAERNKKSPPLIVLSFVGDMLLSEGVGSAARIHGVEYLLEGVSGYFQYDDLTIGNLECAVAHSGQPAPKEFTFRADPRWLPGVRSSGVDALSLANNHTLDYGREALLETIQNLRQNGIVFFGAGLNAESAYAPVYVERRGRSIALIGASRVLPYTSWYALNSRPGIASAYDPALLLEEIRAAAAVADIVAVYLHWGVELARWPEPYQRSLGAMCIDAGADIVVGSHPHVLQGVEFHNGRPIVYSLGNFLFNDNSWRPTMIFQAAFLGDSLASMRIIPCHTVNYGPVPTSDDCARQAVLDMVENLSHGVSINPDGTLHQVTAGRGSLP
jgi:poly-gamma-glutamate capsule biosynthesis protein CapA/YwtB (metallophosphatase superfamily)